MKKVIILSLLTLICTVPIMAETGSLCSDAGLEYVTRQNARLTFKNRSDYDMTLRIVYSYGGLYRVVSLPAHSSSLVTFSTSNTFRLKIKAVAMGVASYHDGGKFSVTCTDTEWTEGEISFSLSVNGTGLGPSISKAEFESDF